MFYGGNATYFLHLKQNKLEGFGKVEFSNDSIYSYKIRNKQEFLLKKQAYKSNDGAVFFSILILLKNKTIITIYKTDI